MTKQFSFAIIGGGAAGFFAAIQAAECFPESRVTIYEKTRQVLSKVRISGGGRCNVTHSCFDPSHLVTHYPRGKDELRGPFSRFQPKNTIEWFESRGVKLKTEEDGRMFPITDQSETIIQTLTREANLHGVHLLLEHGIQSIKKLEDHFEIAINDRNEVADAVLLASGGSPKSFALAQSLGHTIVSPVPSLFTFNLPESPFLDLAGITVPSGVVTLPEFDLSYTGPLLLTHWGISGPAVLKLSAWAARHLHEHDYKTIVQINWLNSKTTEEVLMTLQKRKLDNGAKKIASDVLFELPKQLWRRFVQLSGIAEEGRWASLNQIQLQQLCQYLTQTSLNIDGKTTYKQEFVTCGGVHLKEVNFKTMESKRVPGLFFAGEILNIDGITGGFNFQNAWTTGWIAGKSIGLT